MGRLGFLLARSLSGYRYPEVEEAAGLARPCGISRFFLNEELLLRNPVPDGVAVGFH
jgi:hypothetical protein